MNRARHILTLVSLVVTVGAAVACLALLVASQRRFDLRWAGGVYPLVLSPYAGLLLLAFLSRNQSVSAVVTAIGALAIGAFGVLVLWGTPDAIAVLVLPIILWAVCGIIALIFWESGWFSTSGKALEAAAETEVVHFVRQGG